MSETITIDKDLLESRYSQKIQPLFELGEENLFKYDATIYEKFDFAEEDIEELIRVATDESYDLVDYERYKLESNRFFYATIHATYILAGLKATQAINPLLKYIENIKEKSDIHSEIMIKVASIIGEDAIKSFERYMFENPESSQLISVIESFEKIFKDNPETFSRVEEILVRYVQNDATQTAAFSFAIYMLVEHTRDKHIDLIRNLLETKEVDVMWCGDIEDIEMELGLREERATLRPKSEIEKLFDKYNIDSADDLKEIFSNQGDDDVKEAIEVQDEPKIGRNDPCPCGSGKKYKKCCLNK